MGGEAVRVWVMRVMRVCGVVPPSTRDAWEAVGIGGASRPVSRRDDALADHSDRIIYVHLKDADADGNWAMFGEGVRDTPAVVSAVHAANRFNGWLVVEEESEAAGGDPAAAVRRNRETIRKLVGR